MGLGSSANLLSQSVQQATQRAMLEEMQKQTALLQRIADAVAPNTQEEPWPPSH